MTTQFTSNISYKFEKVNGINTSYTFEAVNGVNAKPFETVYGMSNVHDKYIVVNHDHDKSIVNKRVTFSDERDSEILSESPVECNSRSNNIQQSRVGEKFPSIPELVSSKSNEVRHMHTWFSFLLSMPSAQN